MRRIYTALAAVAVVATALPLLFPATVVPIPVKFRRRRRMSISQYLLAGTPVPTVTLGHHDASPSMPLVTISPTISLFFSFSLRRYLLFNLLSRLFIPFPFPL